MQKDSLIPRVVASPIGVSYLHRRNPWVPVWWSVALPGFGHMYLGQNLPGLLLMSLEILINDRAHINLAIFHSVLGHADKAKAVIDYRWAALYPLFYVFSMIDSYRLAVEYTQLIELEQLQRRRYFKTSSLTPLGIFTLTRRNPVVCAAWAALMSGLGHLQCNRIFKAVILIGWYLTIVMKSGLSQAAVHTFLGQFAKAKEGIDYQWLLFWPSIYIFGIVDAYSDAVEQVNIAHEAFEHRMSKYLLNPSKRQ